MRVVVSDRRKRSAVGLLGPPAIAGSIVVLLLFAAHRVAVTLPATTASILLPFARLFDIALLLGALLLAHAAGTRLLRAFGLASGTAEGAAFAMGLGLGIGGYCSLALGLIGLYRPLVLLGGIAVAAIALRHELALSTTDLAALLKRANQARMAATLGIPAIITLVGLAGFVVLLAALTPPHHWDPLAYHLTSPQRFLQTGRLAPIPGIEFSNLPLTTELLYGIGLAAGSEVFGQLLHGAYAVITGLALWGMTRRYFDGTTAWLALALFCTTPLVLVWARVANNDLTLGCFVTLAVAAALRATPEAVARAAGETRGIALRWLGLAGVFAGLALGSKYQAVYALAPLGCALVFDSYRAALVQGRHRPALVAAVRHAAIFGGVVALVASPWYIKNWLWLGNPVWPTLWGGRDFGPLASDITRDFLRDRVLSPRTPLGYLLLPLQAYLIGDYEQPHVILNPLYLLAPFFLALRQLWRREIWYALIVSGGFSVAFTTGVQELRYLLAVCPLIALITAAGLRVAWERRAWRRPIVAALGCCALLSLGLVALHVGSDRPINYLLGRESHDTYLQRSITVGASYRATNRLAELLQPGDRAIFMHEAQIFYMPQDRAIQEAIRPDHLNLQLLLLSETYREPGAMLAALQGEGIDYLLVNDANIRSWLLSDPNGRLARGKAALDGLAPMLEMIHREGTDERPRITIYRVPAGASGR